MHRLAVVVTAAVVVVSCRGREQPPVEPLEPAVLFPAGELHLVELDDENAVVDDTILIPKTFGRLRTVIVGSDGAIYVSTSNRNDRTPEPAAGENRIYRLTPR